MAATGIARTAICFAACLALVVTANATPPFTENGGVVVFEAEDLSTNIAHSNFRRLYPSLRRGVHNNRWNNPGGPGLFAYSRTYSNEEVFVVFNTASSSQILPARSTSYSAGTVLVNLLNSNETVTVDATPNIPSITVPSATAKIFIAQSLMKPLDPIVVSQSPAHGATNVSTSAPSVLRFNNPMDTNSVQTALTLTPATSGTFAWSALHDTMTFTAAGLGFPGATTNLVHLAATAIDGVTSNSMYAPFDTYFVTASASFTDNVPPTISMLAPANNSIVSGSISISGIASDNVAVVKAEFNIDGGDWVVASGTTSWTFLLNTQNLLNGGHIISARATDSSGNVSPTASVTIRIFNVPGGYAQCISAGNPGDATNCDATVWMRDQAYSFKSFGYSGGATSFIASAISNTCASGQSLFQHGRFGASASSFRYLFDCPAGVYETTLLEAEMTKTGSAQRVFNSFIEGQQVLPNSDLYTVAGGKNIPLTLVFTNPVADAQMEIEFVPQVDNPQVAGVQVRKIADIDSDVDGIPDWWMLAYFNHPTGQDGDNSMAGEDADGDGRSNLQEFLAGTDPTDPNSVFGITKIIATGSDMQVSWTTVSGRTYQLQRANSPDGGATWANVSPTQPGTGGIVTQTDAGGATNSPPQFYRVQVLP